MMLLHPSCMDKQIDLSVFDKLTVKGAMQNFYFLFLIH